MHSVCEAARFNRIIGSLFASSCCPLSLSVVLCSAKGSVQSGLYVSGWLRRGPSGIIATNITDARDTVKSVVQDVKEGRLPPPMVSRDG